MAEETVVKGKERDIAERNRLYFSNRRNGFFINESAGTNDV